MTQNFARHINTNLLQKRVATSTAIQISTRAKAFLESISAANHFSSSHWIHTKSSANERSQKELWNAL
jgi:hypothetical protein